MKMTFYFGILATLLLSAEICRASSVETYIYREESGNWELVKRKVDADQASFSRREGLKESPDSSLPTTKSSALPSPVPSLLPLPPPESGWFEKVGSFFWEVISHNKINDDLSVLKSDILPAGEKESIHLSGWKNRNGRLVRKIFYDSFHSTVSDFSYYVSFFSDGIPASNLGKYLSGIQVIPAKIEVATFFEFNAKVNLTSPVNTGTQEEPVAAVNLSVRHSVKDLILRWEKEDTDEWLINAKGEVTLREF